jgi:crotonobetainyl-CoA:carnitine CoA-transferase CaiB-like acyl-CoA transferase
MNLPGSSPKANTMTPLAGLRVLDASRVLAGPLCGQTLGDLGAEVIKIERPGSGDETRSWGPPFLGPFSAYFLSCNRNKKSLTLDLGRGAGKTIFDRLVAVSDIVLENFRAPSAVKLGIDPASLMKVNPRVIVCSISGFGRTGPMADRPGYDFAIQGLSGLMNITGPVEGPPSKVGVAITDIVTGLYAAIAILACVHARQTSGHGYAIDLALLDCAIASQVNVAQAYLASGSVPVRQGNAHLQIVPYQAFATADDWLILAVGNDGQWQQFCHAAGRPDLAHDSRFKTNPQRVDLRDTLVPILADLLRTQPRAVWERSLTAAGVPHAPVWNHEQLFAEPQIAARGMKVTVRDPAGNPVDLIGSPFRFGSESPSFSMPPRLGQQTDELLSGLIGLSAAEIEALRRDALI